MKVMEITLLTLMPIRDAASLSMLTARIWPPILVLATSRSRSQHRVMAASKIMMICVEGDGCAEDIGGVFWREERGNGRGFGPMNGRARGKFSGTSDTPTAVVRAIVGFVAQGDMRWLHAGGNAASHDHRDEDDAADVASDTSRSMDILSKNSDKICTKRADHQEVAVRGVDQPTIP